MSGMLSGPYRVQILTDSSHPCKSEISITFAKLLPLSNSIRNIKKKFEI
jgi:hypothetical protein